MALTDFEKACIDEIYDGLAPKDGRSTSEQQADMATIRHGSEAERQALISDYITATGLIKVASEIASVDQQIADLTAAKAALQAKQADMQNYVA